MDKNGVSTFWASTLTLLAGLILTGLISLAVVRHNTSLIENAVQKELGEARSRIEERLQRYQFGLRGARGAIITAGEQGISRDVFKRYFLSRDLAHEFPGAHGFGFIRKIPLADEQRYLAKIRQDAPAGFAVRQLSAHTGDRYVIEFIEPLNSNLPALGLDIASETNRRLAAEESMRTGEIQLTGPISLVQTASPAKQSFLMLLPIYRTIVTPPDAEREAALWGWSYAPLVMSEVLGDMKLDPGMIQLKLTDITQPVSPVTFYQSVTAPLRHIAAQASLKTVIYGRTWQLGLVVSPSFVSALHLIRLAPLVFIGVLFSVVSAVLILQWRKNLERQRELIETQTRLARIVESSIDGVIGKTLKGVVTSWNRGAQRIFGYSAREAIGKTLAELIVPDQAQAEEEDILRRIAKGEYIEHFETQRKAKSGRLIDVSVSISPILDANGAVIGASKTVRDISNQKQAEAFAQSLNVRLEQLVEERTRQLDEARRTLRTVLDALPSMIGYWDKHLINHVANKAYHTFFGIEPETLPGKSMQEVLGEKVLAANRPYLDGVLSGVPQVFEREIHGTDGIIRHVLAHYIPDYREGEVKGFYVIVHDVSELVESRLQFAALVSENKTLLQTINKQLLYSVTDTDGRMQEVNELFSHTLGYSPEELRGTSYQKINSGIHDVAFWQHVWATIRQGKTWRGEICNQSRDGQLHWFDSVITPYVDNEEQIETYITLGIDITDRKQADAEVKRLSLLLGNVLNAASEISIIAADTMGLITVFNTGAESILGYSAAEMVGVNSPAVFHVPEEVMARSQELSQRYGIPIEGFRVFVHVPELETAETREWTYVRKNGSQLTVSLTVTAMRDAAGQFIGYLGIATDITEQKRQKMELTAARDQLLMAADVAKLGVWTWTLADNSLQWNQIMFDLYAQPLSLNQGGLTYDHWHSRVHPEDVAATEASLTAAVEGRGHYNPVFRILRPDNTIRFIQADAYIERTTDGRAIRVTGINLDITEHKEFEEKILQAKKQAELASLAKGQFLANMSHEIRTPLNAVLGMLQLLQNTNLLSNQREYVTKTQIAAKSLLGLLNDILDFSKIEAGKLQLDLHAFDLEQLMCDLAVVLIADDEKNVEVIFRVDPVLPSFLVGDRLRLQQILINLAGNALKFTRSGQVVISLEQVSKQEDNVNVRIEVSDTGIGISPEQQARIFDGFTQAEASTARRFGGTGLGLVICKRLVGLMGGQLQLESELGRGSRFWFELSVSVASDSPVATTTLTERTLQILVVDDNTQVGEILSTTIRALGWNATVVTAGNLAVAEVQKRVVTDTQFDVVLMDLNMPGQDGINAARQIRSYSGLQKPVIILMADAYALESLGPKALQHDKPYDGLLVKPVTPQQMVLAIEKGVTIVAGNTTVEAGEDPCRLQGLRILVVEDNEFNRQVIYELLIYEGAEVELAEGGLKGVLLATSRPNTFDVVIMDMQMPDIDGLEATCRIRQHPNGQTVPILAMTANVSSADKQACLTAGMNGHVGKPIDIDEVVSAIVSLVNLRVMTSQTVSEPAAAVTDSLTEPLDTILRRFGNKRELYRHALEDFEPECRRLLGELEQQQQAGKSTEVGRTLHSLKGSFATIGAAAVTRWAEELERQNRQGVFPSESIPMLVNMFEESVAQLRTMFQEAEKETLSPSSVVTSVIDIKEWLERILPLLKTGDMQAVDLADALKMSQITQAQPELMQLVGDVNNLKFDAAMLLAIQLLKRY